MHTNELDRDAPAVAGVAAAILLVLVGYVIPSSPDTRACRDDQGRRRRAGVGLWLLFSRARIRRLGAIV